MQDSVIEAVSIKNSSNPCVVLMSLTGLPHSTAFLCLPSPCSSNHGLLLYILFPILVHCNNVVQCFSPLATLNMAWQHPSQHACSAPYKCKIINFHLPFPGLVTKITRSFHVMCAQPNLFFVTKWKYRTNRRLTISHFYGMDTEWLALGWVLLGCKLFLL